LREGYYTYGETAKMIQTQYLCAFGLLLTFGAVDVARAGAPAACVDTTPHKEQFVAVAPNVKLQIIDWGGTGETMVLLGGLGDNAHVFSQFAFQWTNHFHVIGITRRGYLPSSQPSDGYDVPTRVADDIAVFDALNISKAVLVGHSVAGSELSALAATHPERVDKLVYLDANDLSERNEVPGPPAFFGLITEADTQSLWTYQAATARLEDVREYDPAACPGIQFDEQGALVGSTIPDAVPAAILAGVAAIPPVNWSHIVAPRLGVFAQPTLEGKLPWYTYLSPADQALFDEQYPAYVEWYKKTTHMFTRGNPVPAVILKNAPHYVYINYEADVVRAMRAFLGVQ
jgi:pimeloyl-ACP methyl ester carboxylesterase